MVARQSNKRMTPAKYATSDGTPGSGPKPPNPLRTSKRHFLEAIFVEYYAAILGSSRAA